ncbi:MAG: flagellar biosynthesis anti-sigma factor FlgM [Nitrospirota bacterium]
MKIYGNKTPEGQEIDLTTRKVSKAEIKKRPSESEKIKPTDKVEISGEGKRVAELMAAINQLPEIRNDKVKTIKDAIESGNYQVDPLKIAEKLLNEL